MKKPELAHLMNLMNLACMDGNVSEAEINLLHSIADALGATQEEFDFCVEQANEAIRNNKSVIEVPETDEEKIFFLKNLTLMMMADGKLDDAEKEFVKFIAEKFGYDGDKALGILIENVTEEIRQVVEKQQGSGSSDTRVDGPANTRVTGRDDGKTDEEELKDAIRATTQLGAEALVKHDIPTAFDYLFKAAHIDTKAMRLLLMIVNTRPRLFRLSKEQVALMKDFAEKDYALSQYVYGRWLEALRPEPDSLKIADDYFKKAEKAGLHDATYSRAVLLKAGHYGEVDREEFTRMVEDAESKGSYLANRYLMRQFIYGWNNTEPNPQIVVDYLKEWIDGDESDDIMVVDPAYYNILGEAYAALEDRKKAEKYYRKAIAMGRTEAYSDLYLLYADDEDKAWELLNEGCEAGDGYCLLYRAMDLMNHYDEEREKHRRMDDPDLMEDLITSYEEGCDEAPYFIGNIYYNGQYGYKQDKAKAWHWYFEGANRDHGEAYRMLAVMVANEETPNKLSDPTQTMEYLTMMALRNNCSDVLDIVVERYRDGDYTDYAGEIERYYVPEYESNHDDEDEDEDDDRVDPDDEDYYKVIAIVKTDGKADIIEFDVEEGWDELPEFIGAKRLDAIRTQPLYDITEKLELDGHITAWVDNMGLMKDLPMNPIGCKLYPGPIAGDMILTLEDAKYNPKSFESVSELEQVIAALGAEVDQILLDDGPDDDGRYDAWS